ncbi:PIG-L deacetylase family protein [Humisphaera borealis]|uniref:PIG-L family deacetylase n=1 Tax=Humisphaera borealis TaxID=2807512 RepID=A0A7M2WWM0_9BACT|nr:PIG-L deacetylase family protein [Humisphaera borealis]QOV89231.1 PIG-L family deacetylase [Humisphaera borealis]
MKSRGTSSDRGGMSNGDASTQLALVLSPHPDDESLGCGGTIKLITDGGGAVDVLFMTRGENGFAPGRIPTAADRVDLAARRESEARAACERLGVRRVAFLNGVDGSLGATPSLSSSILAALVEGNYRSVFCPWPYDRHGDHQVTYRMLHQALAGLKREIDVWLYEIWTPMEPNYYVAIDGVLEAKMDAFAVHESQAAVLPYTEAFRGLARYRGLSCPPARAAEAFFYCSSTQLLNHEGIPWPRPPFAAPAGVRR